MRQLFVAIIALVAGFGLSATQAQAAKVEVKGPHICCKQCQNVVGGILAKVDGVSDASCDIKTKMVNFTAKDDKAAAAGVKALADGGFFGKATSDGKDLKIEAADAKKEKADTVGVKDVHVCCGQCQKAITPLFTGSKVSFDGTGPKKTVKIEGKGLDKAEVLDALRKAGFNGTVE